MERSYERRNVTELFYHSYEDFLRGDLLFELFWVNALNSLLFAILREIKWMLYGSPIFRDQF